MPPQRRTGDYWICYAGLLFLATTGLFAEAIDPNGIRTRVTAVKGRCPGPLDDRVIRRLPDGQYRNCHSLTQGKLPVRFGFCGDVCAFESGDISPPLPREILSVIRFDLVNQRRRACGCALMRAQNFTRVFDKALPRFAIAQKLDGRPFE
jgi:hypothetical protein